MARVAWMMQLSSQLPLTNPDREAESHLIANDPRLPGLATLLSPEAFTRWLEEHLSNGRATERSLAVRYVRYKPGVECLAGIATSGRSDCLIGYVTAVPLDDVAAFEKALRHGESIVDRRNGLILRRLPSDVALRGVDDWLNRPEVAAKSWSLGELPPGDWQLEPLRYKPERRFVGRLDRDGVPWGVIRLYAAERYETARHNAKVFSSLGAIAVPQRWGHSRKQRGLLAQWRPGRTLGEAIANQDFEAIDATAIGRALATVHRMNCAKLRRDSALSDAAAVRAAGAFLVTLLPENSCRASELAATIAAALLASPATIGVRHGDFHPGQILCNWPPVLLDWDQAGQGQAADDLGNFLAHLDRDVIEEVLPHAAADRLEQDFLAGYESQNSLPSPATLLAYRAGRMMRLTIEPFRHRQSDWVAKTASYLRHAEELACKASREATSKRSAASRTDPPRVGVDEALPQLTVALDPVLAEPPLAELLTTHGYKASELLLESAQIVRHKRGRRCLVAYYLASRSATSDDRAARRRLTILGKTMRRQHASRDYHIHRSIYESAFASGADGASCPEPIGVIVPWNMWFQRHVDASLATFVLASDSGSLAAERIADAIDKLHRTAPPPDRTHSLDDELVTLAQLLQEASVNQPHLASSLGSVLEQCRFLASRLGPRPVRPCHRDFYGDQVLIRGDRVWLCDFDLFAWSDPALDVGNFAAHLIDQQLRLGENDKLLVIARRAFIERACSINDELTPAAVETWTALSLARLVALSILLPGRCHATSSLVTAFEAHNASR